MIRMTFPEMAGSILSLLVMTVRLTIGEACDDGGSN